MTNVILQSLEMKVHFEKCTHNYSIDDQSDKKKIILVMYAAK